MLEQDADLERQSLGEDLAKKLARYLGASAQVTRKPFDMALPTAMYAIAHRGSTEDGAQGLLDGMASGALPELDTEGLRIQLASVLAGDGLLASGGRFLHQLLGDQLDAVLDRLAALCEVDRGGMSRIVALAVPLAMGIIAKRVHTHDLDASSLSRFLADEKSNVALLVPASLRSTLGAGAAFALTPRWCGAWPPRWRARRPCPRGGPSTRSPLRPGRRWCLWRRRRSRRTWRPCSRLIPARGSFSSVLVTRTPPHRKLCSSRRVARRRSSTISYRGASRPIASGSRPASTAPARR